MENNAVILYEMQTNLEKLFDLNINIHQQNSIEELINYLSIEINILINNNFEKLVSILYRMDVSEQKMKQLLKKNNTENSGIVIARLVIEREQQRIKTKKDFLQNLNTNCTEEKW